MAIAVVIGTLGGSWLDNRLGTRPWLALIGMFLGVAAGFRGVLRVVRDHEKRMKVQAQQERERLHPKNGRPGHAGPTSTPRRTSEEPAKSPRASADEE